MAVGHYREPIRFPLGGRSALLPPGTPANKTLVHPGTEANEHSQEGSRYDR
jgi:hypothetical protein